MMLSRCFTDAWPRGDGVADSSKTTAQGLQAGSLFGHYRLMRLLGEGGFGQVWEAEDTVMDRVVAIKLLKPAYSDDHNFRQRLFREARAAGRLHSPHVVPIHQCGEIDGQLYIDMRLMHGSDLQTVLQDGPLTPQRAVAVVRQTAAALDAAHNAQLIHRDVKPANIFIAEDDFACLLDFGIANAATDSKLTSTGFLVGTYAYIAPERLSADPADHRIDVYALTCVLYECLTGAPPYAPTDPAALITAHLTAPIPRPSQEDPRIPGAFDEVIARGMAKNPRDRYASAGLLALAAGQALSGCEQNDTSPIIARPTTQLASTVAAPIASNVSARQRSAAPADAVRPATTSKRNRRGPTIALISCLSAAVVALVVIAIAKTSTPTPTSTDATKSGQEPTPPSMPASTSRPIPLPRTSTAPPTESNYTIADYIREAHITEIPVHHGDPGSPTINLPVPNGWHTVPEGRGAPYGGIVFDGAADSSDAPTIVAIVSKLQGNVDPPKILQYAPGEIKNLPGYEGSGDGVASTLSGFKAWQLGGSYTKNGKKRTVAQKTVVITGPNGLFVLQLDADALDAEAGPLMDATSVIDDQTTITP